MAEDSGQDKTEAPTGKRLADARKKGQLPRSRELNYFVTLITSAVLLVFIGGHLVRGLQQIMVQHLHLPRAAIMDPAFMLIHLKQAMTDAFWLVLPIGLTLIVADLLSPLLMGGWNFTSEGYSFNFGKLNPLAGLKRIFGIGGLVELIKAIMKVLLIGFVSINLFNFYFDDFMALNRLEVDQAIYRSGDILVRGLLLLCLTLLLLVMVDAPYQLWHHARQLKMTKQEVKDENKESEGSPEVKGRIRRMQMSIAQQRMMEQVPKADVIVTNPTHFAVALQYDPNSAGAPILVAKGTDLIAAQIRNLAVGAGVPLVAAPPLARALYYSTELNHEIPRGLFLAVAQVLAYVFQLRAATENGWQKPRPPSDLQVPEEFRQ